MFRLLTFTMFNCCSFDCKRFHIDPHSDDDIFRVHYQIALFHCRPILMELVTGCWTNDIAPLCLLSTLNIFIVKSMAQRTPCLLEVGSLLKLNRAVCCVCSISKFWNKTILLNRYPDYKWRKITWYFITCSHI